MKAVEGIDAYYTKYLEREGKSVVEDSVIERLGELLTQREKIEAEIETLKKGIKDGMDSEGVDSLQTEIGTFYYSTRKKWEYPSVITEKETAMKVIADGIKKMKEEFELLHKPASETKIFSFRTK